MSTSRVSKGTDQEARSLLQKAVRRGRPDIARATFRYLAAERGDVDWLRSRLPVMVFEEAWGFTEKADFRTEIATLERQYVALACTRKDKSAAGLGALAYELSRGDRSVLDGGDSDRDIKIVSAAALRSDDFFKWIIDNSPQPPPRIKAIENCMTGIRMAGWPWDKSFGFATALLIEEEFEATTSFIQPEILEEFPFWVAIDKHTKMGKEAIKHVAAQIGMANDIVSWVSFYLEGAKTNGSVESDWWEREKQWRFAKLGIDSKEAELAWGLASGLLMEELSALAENLKGRISPHIESNESISYLKDFNDFEQRNLF